MLSVMKGVNGARPRQRVNRTSNRVLRACLVSSRPYSPLRRRRLNRMYQLVVLSMSYESQSLFVRFTTM
jgi:hypothetical protein